MKRALVLALGLLMLSSPSGSARTWAIRADGSGDAPTVSAGLDSAQAGDSVLVYPGEYEVARGRLKDHVSLVSYGGRDVTTFRNTTASGYPILECQYLGAHGVVIEGFCFTVPRPVFNPGVVVSWDEEPGGERSEIVGNAFIDLYSRDQGGAIRLDGPTSVLIADNIFIGCTASEAGGGIVAGLESHVICEANTFYGNRATGGGSGIYGAGSAILEARNCILAACEDRYAIECMETVTSTLDCNDLWSNWGDYAGCVPGALDFHEDPLFCSAAPGTECLYLQECSLCIARASCGQVGAYGIGCDCGGGPSAVRAATWGAIKSMYK